MGISGIAPGSLLFKVRPEPCRRNFARLAGIVALLVLGSAIPARAQTVSFIARRDFVAGGRPIFVVADDFNGDGVQDLALAIQFQNTVSVLLGNGDGSFQPAASFAVGGAPVSLAVGD